MYITPLCFLFGHADAPSDIASDIRSEIERLYNAGIRQFIVGHYGNFDKMAICALQEAKLIHPDLVANLLTPWHPSERPVKTPQGFDGQFYPPLESVPKRFAIVRANEYVLRISAVAVCYACHVGNARRLAELAYRSKVVVVNIAEREKYNNSICE